MRAAALAALAVLLLPAAAFAGPAEEAAMDAQAVVEDRCAQAWSGKAVQKSEALIEVSTVLGQVSYVYEETGAAYLLYWRGVIFHCLGQYEAALDDLEAFVRAEGESPEYAAQVQQARLQLRRAGRKLGEAGLGIAAGWVREQDRFELRLEYAGGFAVRERICTERSPGALHVSRCAGAAGATAARAAAPTPIDVLLRVGGWIAPSFGLGGALEVQHALVASVLDADGEEVGPDLAPTQPGLVAAVGPVIRWASGKGRAVAIHVRPQVAVGADIFELQAGHYNYAQDPAGRQLQGGAWAAVRLGARIEASVQVELANKVVLEGGARVAAFVPSPAALLLPVVEPQAEVALPLDPEASDRLLAGGGLHLLFLPGKQGRLAIGPFVRADLDARWMRVNESPVAVWDGAWKVFSTRRIQAAVVFGVSAEVGG